MKTTRSSFPVAMLLAVASTVQGCGNARDEFLWTLGSALFFVYAVVLMAVLALPAIHRWPFFLKLAERVKKPAFILGLVAALAGVGVTAVGLPRFLMEDFGPRKLLALLGCITFIAGWNLVMWARALTPEKKVGHARVFMLSVSFGLGLGYILVGANEFGG